jgi:alkylhydroperoxidase family enzyme
MARLPYLDIDALKPEDRDLLVRPIHLYRAMANAPGLTRAFLGLANQIRHDSRLDARLREIAILQVAWTTRSAYEWSHHVRIGRQFAVADADIRAVTTDDDAALEPAARLVRRAALGIARDGDLHDDAIAALREVLDEAALTEMLLVSSIYVGLARFLHVARVEVEAEYLPELREFPLPEDDSN